ncbi:MAG TPA: aromatic acid exporter family protein [Bacillales bacterium]|nr:aromatic acid exporter family protein [Bacillales bacterium]
MKIGYRTIKTAMGCGISIGLAEWLHLDYYLSAGILTILCIKSTKKASLKSAFERFIACITGMVFASVFFQLFPSHPLTVTLLLLTFIPAVVKLKAREGVVTSSVILLHFYTIDKLTWAFLGNQLAVIIIGIGVALLLNSYMPSLEREIGKYREKIDENFSIILREFAVFLQNKTSVWDGRQIIETGDLLKEAKILAVKEIDNHLIREKDSYYTYFKMRDEQFQILERLMPILTSLDDTNEQGKAIADFLERLSEKVSPKNTAHVFLQELRTMRKKFRESPLPKDRIEFETRSALLHFTNEMERYLEIKAGLGNPV